MAKIGRERDKKFATFLSERERERESTMLYRERQWGKKLTAFYHIYSTIYEFYCMVYTKWNFLMAGQVQQQTTVKLGYNELDC